MKDVHRLMASPGSELFGTCGFTSVMHSAMGLSQTLNHSHSTFHTVPHPVLSGFRVREAESRDTARGVASRGLSTAAHLRYQNVFILSYNVCSKNMFIQVVCMYVWRPEADIMCLLNHPALCMSEAPP